MKNNLKIKTKNLKLKAKSLKVKLKTKSLKLKANEGGQVLLLSTLVLSSIIMSVSFFVGYLMMQRLRQSVLAVDSAQAFYLSDAGIELELYRFAKGDLDRTCPVFSSRDKITTSVSTNGDFDQGAAALGLEIRSTGCVGDNCKVSRSQSDTSQSLSKVRCDDTEGLCNNPLAACR